MENIKKVNLAITRQFACQSLTVQTKIFLNYKLYFSKVLPYSLKTINITKTKNASIKPKHDQLYGR